LNFLSQQKESWTRLIRKGNKSSAIAAIGNTTIALSKFIAFLFSGSGALFASAMHSAADALNQGFVFVGSVLAEKKPTRRFPTGFGRVINIVCMIAVIIVSIMAYETIVEGIHLIEHPAHSHGFWISLVVLLINLIIDGGILIKAMHEIAHEARVEAKGMRVVKQAFKHVHLSSPPTRLVFYEDLVAVSGALFALTAVIVTSFTSFERMDGIMTVLIGLLMIGVAFRVGFDNMVGLIGVAAPADVEEKIATLILADPDVIDINWIRITQEGRNYHVDGKIELKRDMSLAEADHVKLRVKYVLVSEPNITDVTLGVMEDNGVRNYLGVEEAK
jgi:cation diffusion facilitator family transporter